ncbi:type I secretion system permease/ATPase [Mesorhizobium onobrychidis]|uniref:Type I secretion system permease/ATPase n=1 Tax=Mesorhizobium onobrychidis TaxID=2775404 RepID=A0ABY5QT36_9HYPH|nr:type I secretion system permease/ATPase [Mesorhizobium onobrychidis]UVC14345.1 type I secretion system permease/ATPase [Mesorhizobium onobrychidis]
MSTSNGRLPLSKSLFEIGVFSAAVNILLLVPPLYLLQIYDRVLPSSSMNTLIYLSLFSVTGLAVLGILEIVRSLYANRLAARFDARLGSAAFLAAMNGPGAGFGDVQPLRDLATIRTFVASRSLFFLFDLPFGPLFMVLLYFVHPLLFAITLVGVVIMVIIALLNQAVTSRSGREAGDTLAATMNAAQTFARNFETVRALGMVSSIIEFWGDRFAQSLRASDKVARNNAFYGGLSRTIRILLQLAALGVGAYLVLADEMTAGMMFAASIISGRVLQPIDQIVGSWRQIAETGQAWKRVTALQKQVFSERHANVELPPPVGALTLDQVVYFLPNTDPGDLPLIKRLSFSVNAGECVAIIGPSQAGKSTLARLIVGAIKPRSGVVRIDGADIQNWRPDQLGKHLGYLSQEVELFPGTIGQNISRFEADPFDHEIIAAAQRAQVHQLLLGLPRGYATVIGPLGVRLSGGERQRIGLARAFFGDPRILVLDEPNANLDAKGEAALERAILNARSDKRTVLLITHRPSLAAKCDRILMLRDGQIELYGPAQDVLHRLAQGQNRPVTQSAAANPPVGTANESRGLLDQSTPSLLQN